MDNKSSTTDLWRRCASELIGTALLVVTGLSLVIVMFGSGSSMATVVPSEGLRRLITGCLFGTTGALIALSVVGKVSGAHINPVVTMSFWLMRRMDSHVAICYAAAQFVGGVLGALPLVAWGAMGRSVAFGATLPGPGYRMRAVLAGEIVTTFTMVTLLALFLAFRRIRRFTPAIFPLLYALMVWAEAPVSGTSTNPARSLGPAVISGQWSGWWIYLVGPAIGAFAACLACSFLAKRITEAKLYHFDSEQDVLLRRAGTVAPRG